MDHAALLYLTRQYLINSFCEIGTWEGYTALFLWLNNDFEKQTAIDICENFEGGGGDYHKDCSKYGKYFIDITPIKLIKADTMKYNPDNNYDMVFIDGNHYYDYVNNDFNLSLKMAEKIIAFHDYQNGNNGVDRFINELSEKVNNIYHIKNTSIVYMEL